MSFLKKIYSWRNLIPNFLIRLIPYYIRKKISNIFNPYYFVYTDLQKLPEIKIRSKFNLDHQFKLIEKFELSKKQNSLMTCPDLIKLLHTKFNSDDKFSFLDFGGAKIDFFLDLRQNFKNVEYYFFNLKEKTSYYKILKDKFNYQNLNIIENMNEVFNKDFNFVNFGSSIQYFDNYEIILRNICDNNKLVLFSGQTLFSSNKEKLKKHLIVKQIKGIKDENYCYFFNKKFFFDIFFEKNFKLIFQRENLTDKINFKNFEKIVENIEFTDFFFTKN
jgi:hypothetical protein